MKKCNDNLHHWVFKGETKRSLWKGGRVLPSNIYGCKKCGWLKLVSIKVKPKQDDSILEIGKRKIKANKKLLKRLANV